jgi:excisionase family DNA binding protein
VEEKYYTIDQVAERLEVSRATIYNWMNAGLLEWVHAGPRRRRIAESAIQRFLKQGMPRLDNTGMGGVKSPNDKRNPGRAASSLATA